jgi:hypothetical protein
MSDGTRWLDGSMASMGGHGKVSDAYSEETEGYCADELCDGDWPRHCEGIQMAESAHRL